MGKHGGHSIHTRCYCILVLFVALGAMTQQPLLDLWLQALQK
jgi:hypothetical protein